MQAAGTPSGASLCRGWAGGRTGCPGTQKSVFFAHAPSRTRVCRRGGAAQAAARLALVATGAVICAPVAPRTCRVCVLARSALPARGADGRSGRMPHAAHTALACTRHRGTAARAPCRPRRPTFSPHTLCPLPSHARHTLVWSPPAVMCRTAHPHARRAPAIGPRNPKPACRLGDPQPPRAAHCADAAPAASGEPH